MSSGPPKVQLSAQTGDRLSGLKRGDERGGLVLYNGLLGKPRVGCFKGCGKKRPLPRMVAIGSHPLCIRHEMIHEWWRFGRGTILLMGIY